MNDYIARQISIVKFVIKMRIKALLGKEVRLYSEDRRILEQVIFPHYLGREDVDRVLFVGCAPYTAHYAAMWTEKDFWTIEIHAKERCFGAKNHVTDSVENLQRHFQPGSFDLIIMNGVYGYGVNTRPVCERAFQACFDTLREGGELVLGWDQLPEYSPVPLEEIESLAQFERNEKSVLKQWRYLSEPYFLHTYDFYIKPTALHQEKRTK